MAYNSVVCVGAAGESPANNTEDIKYRGLNRISGYLDVVSPVVSIQEFDRGVGSSARTRTGRSHEETHGIYDKLASSESPALENEITIYVKVGREGPETVDPKESRNISRRVEVVLGGYNKLFADSRLHRTGDGEYELKLRGTFGVGEDVKTYLSGALQTELAGTGLKISLEVHGDKAADLADEVFELGERHGPQQGLLEAALADCPSNRYRELSPREERADTEIELGKANKIPVYAGPRIPQEIVDFLEGVEPSDPRSKIIASLEKLPEQEKAAALKYIEDLEAKSVSLERESRTDHLTGLGNKRGLEENLYREVGILNRKGRDGKSASVGVLFVDLDNLKAVNDAAGHEAGDYAIRVLSRLLERSLKRPADSAYRVGGDEFVAVLPDTDENGVQIIAQRLKTQVERAIRLYKGFMGKERCYITTSEGQRDVLDLIGVSVGVAVVNSGEKKSPKELLEEADAKMRKDKTTRRFRYRAA